MDAVIGGGAFVVPDVQGGGGGLWHTNRTWLHKGGAEVLASEAAQTKELS